MPGGEAGGGCLRKGERCGVVTQLMTTTTCRSGKGKGSQGRSPKKLKHPFRGADFFEGGSPAATGQELFLFRPTGLWEKVGQPSC